MSTIITQIEDILNSQYSQEGYLQLVGEIFDGFNQNQYLQFQQEFSNFTSHIKGFVHLGNYVDPEEQKMAVFAVELLKHSYVENARSTQRSYAKKLIESGNCDAAMVAFYTPGESKWRLSFVRLDYEMKIENGRLKTKENLTPAKRFSYLVGEDEPCYTAIDRFRYFIENENTNPTLDEIEAAFSVEKVTNEFFKLYCEKYQQLKDYLDTNEDFVEEATACGFQSEQFAKKLMGQIVFLYFLQKKGWLGVPVFPKRISEKDYKQIFYTKGAHGKVIKTYLPELYKGIGDGVYVRNGSALNNISEEDQAILAKEFCMLSSKKSWGDGSHTFLRDIFNYADHHDGDFYDNFLEPLFYDTLNRNRGELSYCAAFRCRVPFLSGGLFEPIKNYDWRNSKFNIPDEIFSNASGKNDRHANGILDIFDRFNFTISEDEPLEKEVAIDPEMLGKVFESMLDISDRKSKGAFYTPREIVHYMCQESLINYLVQKTGISEEAVRDLILYGDFMKDEDTVKSRKAGQDEMVISPEIFEIKNGERMTDRLQDIDDALKNVKVVDPAVGSGAFPMGMVNEIVRARQTLTAYMTIGANANTKRLLYANERSPYSLKRQAIKHSIFACDIEPSAVDITMLRLWLSLVIDDDINPEAQSELYGHVNPIPLPNLECNIICGNSLVDEIEGQKLIHKSSILNTAGDAMQISMTQKVFESLLETYLKIQDELFECDDPQKKILLERKLQQYKDQIIEQDIDLEHCKASIKEAYLATKDMQSKPYVLWELEFARVFRDNGGFDIAIGNPPYVSAPNQICNQDLERIRKILIKSKRYECLYKKWDLYIPFLELGTQLIIQNGTMTMIVPYPLTNQTYAKKIRELFIKKYNMYLLADLNDINVFSSATVQNCIPFVQKKDSAGYTIIAKICQNSIKPFFKQDHVNLVQDSKSCIWNLTQQKREKEKYDTLPKLGDFLYISVGFVPNSDEKNKEFVFKKNELISDNMDDISRREYIEGKDLEKYHIKRIRYMEYGTERAPKLFRRPTFPELYLRPKILFNRLGDLKSTIDLEARYIHNDSIIAGVLWRDLKGVNNKSITSSVKKYSTKSREEMEENSEKISLKYLLAVINSDYASFLLSINRSGDYHIYPEHIRNIPIPYVSSKEIVEIEEIVDKIMNEKKEGKNYVYQNELNNKIKLLYQKSEKVSRDRK